MRLVSLAVPLSMLLGSLPAGAREIPALQKFMREEIGKLAAVEPVISDNGHYASGNYTLSLFRLRLKAEFGFDVGAAKVTVEPVAEFFWE